MYRCMIGQLCESVERPAYVLSRWSVLAQCQSNSHSHSHSHTLASSRSIQSQYCLTNFVLCLHAFSSLLFYTHSVANKCNGLQIFFRLLQHILHIAPAPSHYSLSSWWKIVFHHRFVSFSAFYSFSGKILHLDSISSWCFFDINTAVRIYHKTNDSHYYFLQCFVWFSPFFFFVPFVRLFFRPNCSYCGELMLPLDRSNWVCDRQSSIAFTKWCAIC